MVASSQIMRDDARSSLAVTLYFVKLQKAASSMVREILKCKWAVLPVGSIEAATPDIVVVTTIFFSLYIVAKRAFYR
jgi:hypothetical protein